ncbi:Stp1/IreP family PP2C-type Ser/Thr phosphatase [Halostreptopolyspora alba]|uniref:Serine/threonine protein phosphatase PstP n=1 Tax=Halostreptopolyspora alba TaxID=2487137 RepID=A0A3N0E661_9ACTN|nr:Stp1/IreP family PP2C-type Ser/Thr phosphatase [Nocardiopsaceae bacterium YIM 96095]
MTIALRYAAYSDVGCLREGNEDSAYAGPYLLAVADGMGGYAGGEIASSIAISTLMPLDDDVPSAEQMAGSLQQAVDTANGAVSQRVTEEPRLENMGTTLTAMLWSGPRVALIHIGDSRAYLLRDSEFGQITHDHTLVQTLVDEGKISEEEAESHPQRSLLLRALDGRSQVEPDTSILEARVGDRYLLCSDGLSGVVSKETIRETLAAEDTPEAAARRLIDLANRGGGPDNVTAVVADVIDTATATDDPMRDPTIVGAADQRREPVMSPDTPAGRAQNLKRGSGDTAEMNRVPESWAGGAPPPDPEPEPRTRRWWPMVVTFLVIVTVVAVAGFFLARSYLAGQYFIAPSNDGENVALYQGLDTDVAGYDLFEQVEDTGIRLDMLPDNERERVTSRGVNFDNREDADAQVESLRETADGCEADPASCGFEEEQDEQEPGTADDSGEPAGGQ